MVAQKKPKTASEYFADIADDVIVIDAPDDAVADADAGAGAGGEAETEAPAASEKKGGKSKFTTQAAPKTKWATADFSSVAQNVLPPTGTYQGEITKFDLRESETNIKGIIEVQIEDSDGVVHSCDDKWIVVCHLPEETDTRVRKDWRRDAMFLQQLGEAAGVNVNGRDPYDLARDFLGKRVAAFVTTNVTNGIPHMRLGAVKKAIF